MYELELVSFSSVLVGSVASVQTYRLLFSGAAGSGITIVALPRNGVKWYIKTEYVCVVRHPDCYGWTDIFVLLPFFARRLQVCVCACARVWVRRTHWEGRRGGDVNTFHLVKWCALHCSAKRCQNPRWRKQFLNVKSSETFTIPWCMTVDPHLFFIYIYTHIYVGIYIKSGPLRRCSSL